MTNHSSQQRKIGAHVSAAGGIDKAIERAAKIGANTVQVFSASPRSWRRPDLDKIASKEIVEKSIKKAQSEYNMSPIVTHAMYLVNLASPKSEQLEKSRTVLTFDLEFDARIGGAGVVVHPGSHLGKGWENVRDLVAEQVDLILKQTPQESQLLIENSAGQNGKICSDLSELKWLLEQINSPRLGWCVDTCHGFAAGYTLAKTKPELDGEQFKKIKPENNRNQTLIEAITDNDLWDSLKVVHVNDSRDPFASGRDRHANIGQGEIPEADLSSFLSHEQILNKPIILEVPGLDGNGPDKANIDRLKGLL